MHGRRSQASGPQALETGAAVTVPKSFFFRNWVAASAFRCFRNHWGKWKNKSCWGVGDGDNLRQTGSYHNYKDTLFWLHIIEESWHFRLETQLEITTWKYHMYSTPWSSSHRTPSPENQQWHPALLERSCQAARTIQQRTIHFSKNISKIHLLSIFFPSQVKIWSGTDRSCKKLRLIFAF